MFGLDLGNLIAHLRLDDAQYNTALTNAERKLRATASRMTSIGRYLSVRLTAPILAVGVATAKMAMNAEESENLFTISMGKMAESTRIWSQDIAKSLHLNDYEVRRNVSTFNVMLESMGLMPEEANKMSKGLTKLAYDMASFYNLKPAEAFRKIQAGITGEIEPLKRLGIVINETTVRQWALNQGLIEGKRELTETEKIMARYGLIMEQTRKAQGDMWRTLNSVTNVFRSLWSMVQKASISIGNLFLPYLAPVGKIARDLFARFNDLNDSIKRQIILYASIVAVIGPLLIATGLLLKTFAFMIATVKILAGFLSGLTAAIAAPIVAIIALAGTVYVLRAAWKQNIEAIKARLEWFAGVCKDVFDYIANTVIGKWLRWLGSSFLEGIDRALNSAQEEFGGFVKDLGGFFRGIGALARGEDFWKAFTEGWEQTERDLKKVRQTVVDTLDISDVYIRAFGEATVEHLEDLMNAVKKQFGEDADAVISLIREKIGMLQSVTTSVEVAAPAVLQYGDVQEIIDAVKNMQKEILEAGKMTAEQVTAYRSILAEMGRMSQKVYELQTQQLERVAQGYRDIGVEIEVVNKWLGEQKEILEIEYLKAVGGIWGGFKAAGMQIKREIQTWGERAYEFAMTLQDSIARGLENSMRDFDNWKKHLLNMFEEIYWSALRIAFIQPAAQALAGGMTGAFGSLFGGGAGTPAPGVTQSALDYYTAPYKAQEGAYFTRPTLTMLAEKEPEYAIPLSKMGAGRTEINITYAGYERPVITSAEEYMLSDRRIIDVTMQAMQTNLGYARNIQQATRR